MSVVAADDLVRRRLVDLSTGLAESIRRYCAHLRQMASGHSRELISQRERLSKERADHAALKNAQLRGELVDAEGVRRAITTLAATARNGFECIPDKLAERLAVLTDPAECHALVALEIEQVLNDLAAGARSMRLDQSAVSPAPTVEGDPDAR